MPRRLSRCLGECFSWSCRDRMSLGQSTGDRRQLISTQGTWKGVVGRAERRGKRAFRPSVPADGNWRPLRKRESLFIGWAAACLSVISEKLKLDSRAQICFHDIFPLDFSKCILGVSQRLFFKNKSHILFFQTSFIFDI